LAGEPITIFGTGEQARSFTSVYDVVEANLRMAELGRESAGYFNCASGIRVSIQELADFVVAETGGATEIRHEGWKPGDILEFDVDNSRIRSHGISFDTDWRSVVLQLIAHKRLALALSLAAVEPDRPYQSLDAAPIA
jgi:UDP-glucose 4-epimerase